MGVQEIRVNAVKIDNPIIFFISVVLLNLILLTDNIKYSIKAVKLILTVEVNYNDVKL